MMRQTAAIFLDAYRELNAKRLFWIVLILSAAVVGGIAVLGNNDRGMTILGMTIEIPIFSTKAISTAGFYKLVFSTLGVQIWLAWGATILALISTAGLIPDFVSSGSIELSLSKPIGRLRLFLTKYATGLLFVTLQVIVFSLGAFLVIGIRGGAWEPSFFLAIPLVVIFYSYLFCVCALIGLVTRSSITALLLTMLFWFGLWALNVTDSQLLTFKVQAARDVQRTERQISSLQAAIARLEADIAANPDGPPSEPEPAPEPPPEVNENDAAAPGENHRVPPFLRRLAERMRPSPPTTTDARAERLAQQRRQLSSAQTELEDSRKAHQSLQTWHAWIYRVKTVLPKTGETTELLKRYVITRDDRDGMLAMVQDRAPGHGAEIEAAGIMESRPVWWIIGTSLGFQALVLAIGSWIFVRRDF